MSQVQSYKETVTTYVYTVPSPTDMSEISKAYAMISNQHHEVMGDTAIYDDTFKIEAFDDEIRISFVGKVERSAL